MAKIIKYSITLIAFIIITSLFALYFYLLKGVSINNLHYKFINIEQLYIKIDKKLIIRSKNISINLKNQPQTKTKYTDFKKTNNLIKKIIQYSSYFQELNIQHSNINNHKINLILFKDNILNVDTPEIFLQISFSPDIKRTIFKANSLIIKPLNLAFEDIRGDFYSDLLNLYLNINTIYKQTNIKMKLKISNNQITYNGDIYNISSKTFLNFEEQTKLLKDIGIYRIKLKGDTNKANIKIFNAFVKLQDTKIKTNTINISYTKSKIKITIPKLDMFCKNLDLNASIFGTNVTFEPKNKYIVANTHNATLNYKQIPTIKTKQIKTLYHNNILTSTIKNATSHSLKAKDIIVSLKNKILKTSFQTNALFSQDIIHILSIFNIKVPIHQTSGINDTIGVIKYDFNKNKLNISTHTKTKNTKLMLAKNLFLDIQECDLSFKDNQLIINNANLHFKKSIVDVNYKTKNALIDLKKGFIKANGEISNLNLEYIGNISNFKEDFYMDLSNGTITLKNLHTLISLKNQVKVNIDKISVLYPYVKYLKEYKIKDGKASILISNPIKIKANITNTTQNILESNSKPLKKLDVDVLINDKTIKISNKNLNVDISLDKLSTISGFINNVDLKLDHFIDKNTTSNNNSLNLQTSVEAKNMNIKYRNAKIYSQKLSLYYKDYNNSITLNIFSKYNDRNLTVQYKDGYFKLYGINIEEKTFSELTNTHCLKEPNITLYALQNKNSKTLQGFIKINKGYIRELKAFNNILAFINLLPSMVTFQPTGFSSKGYKIKKGYIEYVMFNKVFYFKQLKIIGENMTLDGGGYVDLNTNTIKMNINANLIVKLLKDIPIIGYILLGKDGGLTIRMSITGDLNDPQISKNTALNIIEAPFNIIKRTLLTPLRPFMEE